jgi:DNA repair exonuclease SbcCD ATPase subunit
MSRYRYFNGTSYQIPDNTHDMSMIDYSLSDMGNSGNEASQANVSTQSNQITSYENRAEELETQENEALENYKKYYVYSNLTPADPSYQESLAAAQDTIDQVHADIFVLSNNIQLDLKESNDAVRELTTELDDLRSKNKDLKRRYNYLTNKDNASFIMLDDAFEIYKYQYITNWAMFIGILTLLYAFYKSFNQKVG